MIAITLDPDYRYPATIRHRSRTSITGRSPVPEMRRALWPDTRRRVAYRFTARDRDESALSRAVLQQATGKVAAVGIWPRAMELSGFVLPGNTTLTVVTTDDRLVRIGDYVMLWTDVFTAELVTVSATTATTLTVSSVAGSYSAGDMVIPCIEGLFDATRGQADTPLMTELSIDVTEGAAEVTIP